MKTMLNKTWAAAKRVALPAAAYVFLPVSLAASAGLAGLAVVASLDVWGGVYFVDGVPAAAALVSTVSLAGLWLLTSPKKTSLRARFLSPVGRAGAALTSLNREFLERAMTKALDAARRLSPQVGTSYVEPVTATSAARRKETNPPLVHGVVWGKPMSRFFVMNCPVSKEVRIGYDARK